MFRVFPLTLGNLYSSSDLGAERVIAAEKGNEKIAVEIKSFVGQSPVSEFHKALGQYENYRSSLEELDPERTIWLAVPSEAWNDFSQRPFIQKAVTRHNLELIIFDITNETIVQWIK